MMDLPLSFLTETVKRHGVEEVTFDPNEYNRNRHFLRPLPFYVVTHISMTVYDPRGIYNEKKKRGTEKKSSNPTCGRCNINRSLRKL